MSRLRHFHRFRDLPRELQLHIWDFYERAQPHHRHYFRSMEIWPGRLYAGADENTNMRVSTTIANAGDPNQTQVPDAAITPKTKIQLPGSGNLGQNWVSRDQVITAASFVRLQGPEAMASSAYIWVNLKNDSFCFARTSRASQDFLQYLGGVAGLLPLTPAPQSPVMSHWFHQIQKLVLIKSAVHQTLGPFDRQILPAHRSLRRLTIVANLDPCRCRGPRDLGPAIGPVRVSLADFLEISQAFLRICTCGQLRDHLDELQQLETDLVDLFQTRTNSAPPVIVNVEMEL